VVDDKYLDVGLCGMARAHAANAMAGHLGAALVAGYFIGQDLPDLPASVYGSIEQVLDRIVRGDESLWFDQLALGISIPQLFQPFAFQPAERRADLPEMLEPILSALTGNIDSLRQSGHNVIFAALAVRALREHERLGTPDVVVGIQRLIALFNRARPGRGYFGKARGWVQGDEVPLEAKSDFPPYRSQQEMVERVVDELICSGSLRRQGFGGLFHVINHAAALTELARFGYGTLARQGWPAHHLHLRLWRSLPDVEGELGPLRAAQNDPRTPEYWQEKESNQWSAHLTHRVKTMYGLFVLLRFIDSANIREQAAMKFRYLMG
jgi:hypothetical protein